MSKIKTLATVATVAAGLVGSVALSIRAEKARKEAEKVYSEYVEAINKLESSILSIKGFNVTNIIYNIGEISNIMSNLAIGAISPYDESRFTEATLSLVTFSNINSNLEVKQAIESFLKEVYVSHKQLLEINNRF